MEGAGDSRWHVIRLDRRVNEMGDMVRVVGGGGGESDM